MKNTNNPIISVVITTFLDLDLFLDYNLEDIKLLLADSRAEIIIVDDSNILQQTWTKLWELLDNGWNASIVSVCTVRNMKQGAARNIAMELASGEYIWFVDADDSFSYENCNYALELFSRHGADIIVNNFMYEEGASRRGVTNGSLSLSSSDYILTLSVNATSCACWPYFFRLEFLRSVKNYFPEGVFFEDLPFVVRAFALTERSVFTGATVYTHRVRSGSTSQYRSFSRSVMRFRMAIYSARELFNHLGFWRAIVPGVLLVTYHGIWAGHK